MWKVASRNRIPLRAATQIAIEAEGKRFAINVERILYELLSLTLHLLCRFFANHTNVSANSTLQQVFPNDARIDIGVIELQMRFNNDLKPQPSSNYGYHDSLLRRKQIVRADFLDLYDTSDSALVWKIRMKQLRFLCTDDLGLQEAPFPTTCLWE